MPAVGYEEAFNFVDCGADVVALTSWMSVELIRLRSSLNRSTPASSPVDIDSLSWISRSSRQSLAIDPVM
jgi:hypothetical protein